MTCNRVIIIHRGKILASDAPDNLVKTLEAGGPIRVEVLAPLSGVESKFGAVEGVESISASIGADGYVSVVLHAKAGSDPREALYNIVAGNGWTLRELSRSRTTLEDIFVQITRDEDEAAEERREQRGSLLR